MAHGGRTHPEGPVRSVGAAKALLDAVHAAANAGPRTRFRGGFDGTPNFHGTKLAGAPLSSQSAARQASIRGPMRVAPSGRQPMAGMEPAYRSDVGKAAPGAAFPASGPGRPAG
ncbi:hypothetical protein STVA_34810 [Allostella vacuolata]|nr:hypothetical protein STVA_34810 [Stella vacuolata]